MGLRSKLLIAFALVALVPLTVVALVSSWLTRQSLREVIGSSIASISQEKASAIALIVANRVDEAEVLARAAHIREAALRANSTYEGRQQAEIRATIKRLDAEWISARKGGGSALAQSVLANPLSRSLKAYQQRNPDRYGEIFVTDVRGAAIGQTKLLSDHMTRRTRAGGDRASGAASGGSSSTTGATTPPPTR